jgi:hypothetical protein
MSQGWWISIVVVDRLGSPVADVPARDFWLVDCDPARNLVLCGGYASSQADSSTNYSGKTTMANGALAAGGRANGIAVVVQGVVLKDPPGCTAVKCAPIRVRSPDLDGSLTVRIRDLAMFASHFSPGTYDDCSDFNINGVIDVQDFAIFAPHYAHSCP